MKYKNEIDGAYKSLGYEPRDNQPEVCDEILVEFLDNKKQNVVVCLDTGAGKSIIGAVVSKVIEEYEGGGLASAILMHQNSLTEQYYNSFKHLSDFSNIRGASTYPCELLKKKEPAKKSSAEGCIKFNIGKTEQSLFCGTCEYDKRKSLVNKIPHLITNYSYFFSTTISNDFLEQRFINIFDEAHLVNEVYAEGGAINVSEKTLDAMYYDIQSQKDDRFASILESIKVAKELVPKITEQNHKQYLKKLNELCSKISTTFAEFSELSKDVSIQSAYLSKSAQFMRECNKINKYFNGGEYTVNLVDNELTVKPTFIRDDIGLVLAKYNLFMSGTISKDFAKTTFGVSDESTAFISKKTIFPSEHRPIRFLGDVALNAKAMSDKNVISNMISNINTILELHIEDKGIILTPSFNVSDTILAGLKTKSKVFCQARGESIVETINRFKEYSQPAILISPSLWEGVDLEGENSRFQIIVKAPYASMGDKRISYIASTYGTIYRQMTLYKMLQGIGRSVRNKDDFAFTYFLDKNCETLYNSSINLWKDRYTVE